MAEGKRILMIVGDFVEDYEVMVPFQTLQAVGHTVHAVCPGKNSGEKIATAVHDFEGHQTYSEKPGHGFTVNANFDDLNVNEYHALVLPGGRAPEYLRLNQKVIEVVKHFSEANKPIASICHGLQILAAADVLKGKRVTGYMACAPEIRLAGATYEDCSPNTAITDGNLCTAVAWPGHPAWLAQFLSVLGTNITHT